MANFLTASLDLSADGPANFVKFQLYQSLSIKASKAMTHAAKMQL